MCKTESFRAGKEHCIIQTALHAVMLSSNYCCSCVCFFRFFVPPVPSPFEGGGTCPPCPHGGAAHVCIKYIKLNNLSFQLKVYYKYNTKLPISLVDTIKKWHRYTFYKATRKQQRLDNTRPGSEFIFIFSFTCEKSRLTFSWVRFRPTLSNHHTTGLSNM